MNSPPDPLVFVKIPLSKIVKSSVFLNPCFFGGQMSFPFECSVIPYAAFMRYIKSYTVIGTVEQTLEKKKVLQTDSMPVLSCESSLEVTTGFEFVENISSETTLT
ncbi:hypothetical protein ACTFIZ_005205 [Dictyostelium cf. discoideum]